MAEGGIHIIFVEQTTLTVEGFLEHASPPHIAVQPLFAFSLALATELGEVLGDMFGPEFLPAVLEVQDEETLG
jgi:hypothetical protein